MNRRCIILLVFSLITFFSLGQFTIQTGYDFGHFTRSEVKQRPLNSLNRLNVTNEYIFNNNIIVSINTGIDFHHFNYDIHNRTTFLSGNSSIEEYNYGRINIQNYRLGFSLGYQLAISNSSSILLKGSYDQYFVNNILIKESYKITSHYDVPANQIDNTNPISTIREFDPLINLDHVGFRNKFLKENRSIIFSLQYRYQFDKCFIAPSIGYSPWNRGSLGRSGRNILFFGFNLGYTLPFSKEKTKENE
jgi:hypothetical protein